MGKPPSTKYCVLFLPTASGTPCLHGNPILGIMWTHDTSIWNRHQQTPAAARHPRSILRPSRTAEPSVSCGSRWRLRVTGSTIYLSLGPNGSPEGGRIAYHVLYFGESAVAQMDSLFKMLENKSDWAHDRVALDLEVAGINTRSRITSTTLNCLEICKSRTGRYPIVYSRASWVNSYLQVSDLPRLDWWLATYRKPSLLHPKHR